MKKLVSLIMILGSLQVMAHPEPDLIFLHCPIEKGDRFGSARLVLDQNKYHRSGYLAPVRADLRYNYSATTDMTCVGRVKSGEYDVSCVGYYDFLASEITQVRFLNKGNQVVALWKTNRIYGSKNMESVCELRGALH